MKYSNTLPTKDFMRVNKLYSFVSIFITSCFHIILLSYVIPVLVYSGSAISVLALSIDTNSHYYSAYAYAYDNQRMHDDHNNDQKKSDITLISNNNSNNSNNNSRSSDVNSINNNLDLISDIKLSKNDILKVIDTDFVLGCDNANNVIIEYSSLACPHCADFHRTHYKEIKEKYIDKCKVKYIYRHFPTSPQSLTAAMLTCCSNNYYNYVDMLFSSQKSWGFSRNYKSILANIAKLNSMELNDFTNCINNKELANKIISHAYQANKVLDINYTPTIFVNGTKIYGNHINSIAIEKELIK